MLLSAVDAAAADANVLKPWRISVNQLAKALAVDVPRLNEIGRGRRGISADTASRLSRHLGTSAQFRMNLQSAYDLRMAERQKGAALDKAVQPHDA